MMTQSAAHDLAARRPDLQKRFLRMLDYAKTAPAAALRARKLAETK
jgi:hypothetical protein